MPALCATTSVAPSVCREPLSLPLLLLPLLLMLDSRTSRQASEARYHSSRTCCKLKQCMLKIGATHGHVCRRHPCVQRAGTLAEWHAPTATCKAVGTASKACTAHRGVAVNAELRRVVLPHGVLLGVLLPVLNLVQALHKQSRHEWHSQQSTSGHHVNPLWLAGCTHPQGVSAGAYLACHAQRERVQADSAKTGPLPLRSRADTAHDLDAGSQAPAHPATQPPTDPVTWKEYKSISRRQASCCVAPGRPPHTMSAVWAARFSGE